ncbi:MAG TPA: MucB/RseB C-terminal domain-containing protein [Caldimonas sp.]|nr:MucB/RseB C-terminal domain-containing protein [Caldimonas sp.]HEX2542274.1 MucB/RseB C-terminal domain-containing protein [Caldimonas sp.]
MRLRAVAPLTVACMAIAFGAPAWSQQPAQATAAGTPAEMRAWLLRIHDAASRRNFQGTFVVSGGSGVASARIAHFWDGPNQYERIESLDGRQRKVFRHNDVVHTLWPGSQVAMIEQRGQINSFPALLQAGDDGISDWYEVRDEGLERVAGREANVLAVKARDGLRYGYRLWADRASGLLLRADVLGESGNVLETSAFSEVTIGIRPQPDSVLSAMRKLDGYRLVRPVLTPTQLETEGWVMRQVAPGFRRVSCVSRQIDTPGESGSEPSLPPVIQTIYSDGLTYVSVFIEPYRADRHARPMFATMGATATLAKRHGDWWVTIVGDTPPATLKLFAAALERKKP